MCRLSPSSDKNYDLSLKTVCYCPVVREFVCYPSTSRDFCVNLSNFSFHPNELI